MSVRAITSAGDWTFGQGINNYLTGNAEVSQNIQTRLQSFLGNCFFAVNDGIDWFNLLGGKDQTALNLAVNACILNAPNVTGINQLFINFNTTTRAISIQYQVQTTYSTYITNTFVYDVGTL